MRWLFGLFYLGFFASCSNNSVGGPAVLTDSLYDAPSFQPLDSIDSISAEMTAAEMQNVWVLILDTSLNYQELDAKMYNWSSTIAWSIDTMERSYNVEKKELVLSEKSEDELYRGAYFPRRYGVESLSIEYLNTYTEKTRNNTFALVAGIYDAATEANKAWAKCIKVSQRSFVLPCQLYMGCMH